MRDETEGSGEVHAHISSRRPEGRSDLDPLGEPWERPENGAGPRDRLGAARGRAGEVLDEARDRADLLLDRAASALERTGVVRKVQEHPFAALGIAFGVGLLAAGTSDNRSRSMLMAKGQVRGMIIAGLSSLLMNELRAIAGPYGGVLDAFLGDGEEDEDDFEPAPRRGPGRAALDY